MEIKAKKLQGLKEKVIGLIGAKKAYPVVFRTRFGIHTFFMKFPIDVIVLNKENRVVNIKENLPTNRIFLWNPKYSTVLELPVGFVNQNRIKIKSSIIF